MAPALYFAFYLHVLGVLKAEASVTDKVQWKRRLIFFQPFTLGEDGGRTGGEMEEGEGGFQEAIQFSYDKKSDLFSAPPIGL